MLRIVRMTPLTFPVYCMLLPRLHYWLVKMVRECIIDIVHERKYSPPSSREKDWRVLVALATIVIECQHECTSLTITRLVRRCNEEQVNVEIRMVKPVAGTTPPPLR